jgi:hypothetical protein
MEAFNELADWWGPVEDAPMMFWILTARIGP